MSPTSSRSSPGSRDDAVIVRSTIELGRNLGMHVVAKRVETADAFDHLADDGCHTAQGYHLSPPLPVVAADRISSAAHAESL